MYIAGREEESVQLASYRETVIFFGVGTSTVYLSVRPSFFLPAYPIQTSLRATSDAKTSRSVTSNVACAHRSV